MHETPRLSAKFSSYDPFKTARLNQAGGKNKLCHSCGVTATLATKNHKALYSLLRDQEVGRSLKPLPKVANGIRSRWPVARSRWPGPSGPVRGPVRLARRPVGSRWPVARFRWPGFGGGPGGPVGGPARSRWPGPGGLVPVAWSRWPVPWPGPGGPVAVVPVMARSRTRCRSRFKGACRPREKGPILCSEGTPYTRTTNDNRTVPLNPKPHLNLGFRV